MGFKVRKKEVYIIYIFIIFAIFTYFSFAAVFEINSEAHFNSGTYNRTYYNSSGYVELDLTYDNGTYTSNVFDAGSYAEWNNISWVQGVPYRQELPDNKEVESDLDGANMTGNILLMHMNENSGDIIDYSGEGNDGALTGATYGASGKLNDAIYFDGSGDYIKIDRSATTDLINNFTINLWINPENQNGRIMENNNRYGIHYDTTWKYVTAIGNAAFKAQSSTNSVSLDTWTNVVVIYSTSGNKIYINGQQDGTNAFNSDITNHGDLYIASYGGTGTYFKGIIDEVAIFNRTLSGDEILNIYKRGILKLNLTAKSCDDVICDGESWVDINDTSPQDLSVDNNTYFQYKFGFETDDVSYSPELYNVSIDYNAILEPTINLISPANSSESTSANITFAYNISSLVDINNCSLILNNVINETNSSVAKDITLFFNKTLSNGDYNWSINCTDQYGQINGSDAWNLIVNFTAPEEPGNGNPPSNEPGSSGSPSGDVEDDIDSNETSEPAPLEDSEILEEEGGELPEFTREKFDDNLLTGLATFGSRFGDFALDNLIHVVMLILIIIFVGVRIINKTELLNSKKKRRKSK